MNWPASVPASDDPPAEGAWPRKIKSRDHAPKASDGSASTGQPAERSVSALSIALADVKARVTVWSKYVAYAALIGLIVITGATLLDVVLRFLFNSPLYGLNDVISLAMPVVISGCFPAGLALRSNIAIRFLGDALGRRAGLWFEVFGDLMLTVFVAVIAWQVTIYAGELGSRETPLLGWPVQPTWYVVSVMVGLAIAVGIVHLVESVVVAARGGAAVDRAPTAPGVE